MGVLGRSRPHVLTKTRSLQGSGTQPQKHRIYWTRNQILSTRRTIFTFLKISIILPDFNELDDRDRCPRGTQHSKNFTFSFTQTLATLRAQDWSRTSTQFTHTHNAIDKTKFHIHCSLINAGGFGQRDWVSITLAKLRGSYQNPLVSIDARTSPGQRRLWRHDVYNDFP